MKRWGVIIAVAFTLLLRNAREVKAVDTCSLVPCLPIVDPVICPDGCILQSVVTGEGGDLTFNNIYTDTNGAPLAVPGGIDPTVLAAYSKAVTPSTNVAVIGGGEKTVTTGTLGTQYADGRYAGFYKAPNGQYFPITVTDKNAGRKAKYHPSDTYNCPSDQEPYFGTDAETWTDCCRGGVSTQRRRVARKKR